MTKQRKKVDLRRLAAKQHGRVSRAQLLLAGVSDDQIQVWLKRGHLTRVLRKVYAVGHTAPSREADLWTAVLYAGPGAVISHSTAAHWRGLINRGSSTIEVSTPRQKVRSIGSQVLVYPQRARRWEFYKGIPVTTIPDTMLDLAATQDIDTVRTALAKLDFRKQLDVRALEAVCGHGRHGSRRLRKALEHHQPQLALTNEELERRFLLWCERNRIPIPRFNTRLHGVLVDAYWPEHKLVVEMDGLDNHSSPAQGRRDHRNDLTLRTKGLTVIRYDWVQLHEDSAKMYADLMAQMREPAGRS